SWPTPAGCARSSPARRACASGRATRARWRAWSSACSPTTACATASSPRPPSTCCASTGATSRGGPSRSTAPCAGRAARAQPEDHRRGRRGRPAGSGAATAAGLTSARGGLIARRAVLPVAGDVGVLEDDQVVVGAGGGDRVPDPVERVVLAVAVEADLEGPALVGVGRPGPTRGG